MPDLTLLSKEDLAALASRNVEAMSEEGRQIAFGDLQKQPVPENIDADAVSNIRKFAYGFEKTKSDVGLLYRTLQVKAGLGKFDGFDYTPAEEAYGERFANAAPEVKAAVLAKIDEQKLAQDYPVLSQQEGGGWAQALGSFAGALFSPTTLIPVGSAAKIGYKGLAVVGAGFGAEYNALDQLANTAKIDPKEVAMVSGISAIATPATAKGLSLLGQGVKKALVGRSSPSVQSKANETMLEIQGIINQEVAKTADGAAPPKFDELLPIIQQRTGLSLDELKAVQVQSDYKVRLPQSKQSAMQAMNDEASALNPFTSSNAMVRGARDFLGIVSTDIARINPLIGGRLKKHDAAVGVQTSKYIQRAEPFVKLMKSLPANVMNQVNRHLGSEDFRGAKAILSRYDSSAGTVIDDAQRLLNDIRDDLIGAGYKFNKIENYFPLKVRSYKDFLESIGKEYKQPIERALEARAKKLGFRDVNAMPESEAESVIAKALKQRGGKLSEKSLSSMSRKVFLDDKIIEQYKSPHEALIEHISDSVSRVQKRLFFGEAATQKGIKSIELEDSVEKLVAKEIKENRMSAKDFGKLKELLEARFGMGERKTGLGANIAKNAIYQMTLANPLSALTQVADLGMSVFANGLLPTLKAVVGRPKIKLEDLLSDQLVSAEIGTVGKMAKALDFTFTWSGFKAIDKLGKETLINAAYNNFQKMVRTDKGVQQLRKRFGKVFDNEFDMLVSDLRAGNITDNVKMLAFSELANFQPISLSEMPLKYLQADAGRVFYALKSFTLKQFDVMRREIIHELTDGNPVQGMRKFIAYATILPLSGATVQEVKDFISRGDEISIEDIPDQMAINAIKLMGTSQWVVENRLKKGQFGAAIGEAVMPPITLLDGLKEELQAIYEGDFDPQTSTIIRQLPPYGKFIQDTFLGAREVRRIKDILED